MARRSTPLPDGQRLRTAVVPVTLRGDDYRLAHTACHNAARAWNWLVERLWEYWRKNEHDPTQKELRALLNSAAPSVLYGLHAHGKQELVDSLQEAVQTYRTNRDAGDEDARAPHNHHQYRPLYFTAGKGWMIKNNGRTLRLSLGREAGVILLPMPVVHDPVTGGVMPPEAWRAMRLCWNMNRRQWALHIMLPTVKPSGPEGGRKAGLDPGIINQTLAVETDTAYEVLIVNDREARAARHYANKRVDELQSQMDRCVKGSRRWRKKDVKLRRVLAHANARVDNVMNQTTAKVDDFCRANDVSSIAIGDTRGIEKNTWKNEHKRVKHHKSQRRRLSQWANGKFRAALEWKRAHPLSYINESYSSQTCPACLTRNHPKGRNYHCKHCCFTCHRDAVGAINILMKARYGRYVPIDVSKPIHITYLRATPLHTSKRRSVALGNAPDPGPTGNPSLRG